MQVAETYDELFNIIDTTANIGYVVLQRKMAGKLHEGHAHLIEYMKSVFDYTVVSFWDSEETINFFYEDIEPIFGEKMHPEWDSTACINWCESHGVDYVLIPPENYTNSFYQGMDTTAMISWVDNLWQTENYGEVSKEEDSSEYNNILRGKSFMMGQRFLTKDWTYVASWKDGKIRFIMKDFVEKYKNFTLDLIEPVKSPDGLYYSSEYFNYTQEEKDIIKQIPDVVDSTGYNDIQLLINELNKLDTGVGFEVYRIKVTEGGIVGAANDFISIYFRMADPNIADVYPIYKKGVR